MIRRLICGMAAAAFVVTSSVGTFAQGTSGKDIVTTAVEAGSFKTLVAAVKAAGLVETLQG